MATDAHNQPSNRPMDSWLQDSKATSAMSVVPIQGCMLIQRPTVEEDSVTASHTAGY